MVKNKSGENYRIFLVLLILIILACFGYMYFEFVQPYPTGLITYNESLQTEPVADFPLEESTPISKEHSTLSELGGSGEIIPRLIANTDYITGSLTPITSATIATITGAQTAGNGFDFFSFQYPESSNDIIGFYTNVNYQAQCAKQHFPTTRSPGGCPGCPFDCKFPVPPDVPPQPSTKQPPRPAPPSDGGGGTGPCGPGSLGMGAEISPGAGSSDIGSALGGTLQPTTVAPSVAPESKLSSGGLPSAGGGPSWQSNFQTGGGPSGGFSPGSTNGYKQGGFNLPSLTGRFITGFVTGTSANIPAVKIPISNPVAVARSNNLNRFPENMQDNPVINDLANRLPQQLSPPSELLEPSDASSEEMSYSDVKDKYTDQEIANQQCGAPSSAVEETITQVSTESDTGFVDVTGSHSQLSTTGDLEQDAFWAAICNGGGGGGGGRDCAPPCGIHMLLTEIKSGDLGFIEIYNPLDISLDLSNYYLTDASQEDIKAHYYEGQPLGGFIFKFPGGAIDPGEFKVVAIDTPENIKNKFGVDVDYDVGDVPTAKAMDALKSVMPSANELYKENLPSDFIDTLPVAQIPVQDVREFAREIETNNPSAIGLSVLKNTFTSLTGSSVYDQALEKSAEVRPAAARATTGSASFSGIPGESLNDLITKHPSIRDVVPEDQIKKAELARENKKQEFKPKKKQIKNGKPKMVDVLGSLEKGRPRLDDDKGTIMLFYADEERGLYDVDYFTWGKERYPIHKSKPYRDTSPPEQHYYPTLPTEELPLAITEIVFDNVDHNAYVEIMNNDDVPHDLNLMLKVYFPGFFYYGRVGAPGELNEESFVSVEEKPALPQDSFISESRPEIKDIGICKKELGPTCTPKNENYRAELTTKPYCMCVQHLIKPSTGLIEDDASRTDVSKIARTYDAAKQITQTSVSTLTRSYDSLITGGVTVGNNIAARAVSFDQRVSQAVELGFEEDVVVQAYMAEEGKLIQEGAAQGRNPGMIMPGQTVVFVFKPEYDYWKEMREAAEKTAKEEASKNLIHQREECPDLFCEDGKIVNPEVCLCESKDWECPDDLVCKENEIIDPFYCTCIEPKESIEKELSSEDKVIDYDEQITDYDICQQSLGPSCVDPFMLLIDPYCKCVEKEYFDLKMAENPPPTNAGTQPVDDNSNVPLDNNGFVDISGAVISGEEVCFEGRDPVTGECLGPVIQRETEDPILNKMHPDTIQRTTVSKPKQSIDLPSGTEVYNFDSFSEKHFANLGQMISLIEITIARDGQEGIDVVDYVSLQPYYIGDTGFIVYKATEQGAIKQSKLGYRQNDFIKADEPTLGILKGIPQPKDKKEEVYSPYANFPDNYMTDVSVFEEGEAVAGIATASVASSLATQEVALAEESTSYLAAGGAGTAGVFNTAISKSVSEARAEEEAKLIQEQQAYILPEQETEETESYAKKTPIFYVNPAQRLIHFDVDEELIKLVEYFAEPNFQSNPLSALQHYMPEMHSEFVRRLLETVYPEKTFNVTDLVENLEGNILEFSYNIVSENELYFFYYAKIDFNSKTIEFNLAVLSDDFEKLNPYSKLFEMQRKLFAEFGDFTIITKLDNTVTAMQMIRKYGGIPSILDNKQLKRVDEDLFNDILFGEEKQIPELVSTGKIYPNDNLAGIIEGLRALWYSSDEIDRFLAAIETDEYPLGIDAPKEEAEKYPDVPDMYPSNEFSDDTDDFNDYADLFDEELFEAMGLEVYGSYQRVDYDEGEELKEAPREARKIQEVKELEADNPYVRINPDSYIELRESTEFVQEAVTDTSKPFFEQPAARESEGWWSTGAVITGAQAVDTFDAASYVDESAPALGSGDLSTLPEGVRMPVGNNVAGHDETSEYVDQTWRIMAASPGGPPKPPMIGPPGGPYPYPLPPDFDDPIICIDIWSDISRQRENILPEEEFTFPVPSGYEVIREPFSLDCEDELIEVSMSIADYWDDITVLRCSEFGCVEIQENIMPTKEVICDGETISHTTLDEITKTRYLSPDNFTVIIEQKRTLSEYDALSSGRYSVIYRGKEPVDITISSLKQSIAQPLNPALSIASTPVIVSVGAGVGQVPVDVVLPWVVIPGYDENSFAVYYKDADSWEMLESEIDREAKTIKASVNDLRELTSGKSESIFAVLGIACGDVCIKSKLTKVYNPGVRDAIILVHGATSTPSTWNFLIDDMIITKQPWQIWTFAYSTARSVEEVSKELEGLLLQNNNEFDNIHFITHSVGGFIAQKTIYDAALHGLPFVGKTRKIILAGVPSEGIPGLEVYEKYYNWINKQRSVYAAFKLHPDVVEDVVDGFVIPQIKGVDYYVVAGTKPYEFTTGFFKIGSEELFGMEEPNDGLVTTKSAQRVGDEYITDHCKNYFEVDLHHTDLIDHPLARKIILRLVGLERIQENPDEAVAGYNQFIRLEIDLCRPGDKYVVVGKRGERPPVESCECGDGICGLGENEINCPVDCLRTPSPMICLILTILLYLLTGLTVVSTGGYLYIRRIKKEQPESIFKWSPYVFVVATIIVLLLRQFLCFNLPLLVLITSFIALYALFMDYVLPLNDTKPVKKRRSSKKGKKLKWLFAISVMFFFITLPVSEMAQYIPENTVFDVKTQYTDSLPDSNSNSDDSATNYPSQYLDDNGFREVNVDPVYDSQDGLPMPESDVEVPDELIPEDYVPVLPSTEETVAEFADELIDQDSGFIDNLQEEVGLLNQGASEDDPSMVTSGGEQTPICTFDSAAGADPDADRPHAPPDYDPGAGTPGKEEPVQDTSLTDSAKDLSDYMSHMGKLADYVNNLYTQSDGFVRGLQGFFDSTMLAFVRSLGVKVPFSAQDMVTMSSEMGVTNNQLMSLTDSFYNSASFMNLVVNTLDDYGEDSAASGALYRQSILDEATGKADLNEQQINNYLRAYDLMSASAYLESLESQSALISSYLDDPSSHSWAGIYDMLEGMWESAVASGDSKAIQKAAEILDRAATSEKAAREVLKDMRKDLQKQIKQARKVKKAEKKKFGKFGLEARTFQNWNEQLKQNLKTIKENLGDAINDPEVKEALAEAEQAQKDYEDYLNKAMSDGHLTSSEKRNLKKKRAEADKKAAEAAKKGFIAKKEKFKADVISYWDKYTKFYNDMVAALKNKPMPEDDWPAVYITKPDGSFLEMKCTACPLAFYATFFEGNECPKFDPNPPRPPTGMPPKDPPPIPGKSPGKPPKQDGHVTAGGALNREREGIENDVGEKTGATHKKGDVTIEKDGEEKKVEAVESEDGKEIIIIDENGKEIMRIGKEKLENGYIPTEVAGTLISQLRERGVSDNILGVVLNDLTVALEQKGRPLSKAELSEVINAVLLNAARVAENSEDMISADILKSGMGKDGFASSTLKLAYSDYKIDANMLLDQLQNNPDFLAQTLLARKQELLSFINNVKIPDESKVWAEQQFYDVKTDEQGFVLDANGNRLTGVSGEPLKIEEYWSQDAETRSEADREGKFGETINVGEGTWQFEGQDVNMNFRMERDGESANYVIADKDGFILDKNGERLKDSNGNEVTLSQWDSLDEYTKDNAAGTRLEGEEAQDHKERNYAIRHWENVRKIRKFEDYAKRGVPKTELEELRKDKKAAELDEKQLHEDMIRDKYGTALLDAAVDDVAGFEALSQQMRNEIQDVLDGISFSTHNPLIKQDDAKKAADAALNQIYADSTSEEQRQEMIQNQKDWVKEIIMTNGVSEQAAELTISDLSVGELFLFNSGTITALGKTNDIYLNKKEVTESADVKNEINKQKELVLVNKVADHLIEQGVASEREKTGLAKEQARIIIRASEAKNNPVVFNNRVEQSLASTLAAGNFVPQNQILSVAGKIMRAMSVLKNPDISAKEKEEANDALQGYRGIVGELREGTFAIEKETQSEINSILSGFGDMIYWTNEEVNSMTTEELFEGNQQVLDKIKKMESTFLQEAETNSVEIQRQEALNIILSQSGFHEERSISNELRELQMLGGDKLLPQSGESTERWLERLEDVKAENRGVLVLSSEGIEDIQANKRMQNDLIDSISNSINADMSKQRQAQAQADLENLIGMSNAVDNLLALNADKIAGMNNEEMRDFITGSLGEDALAVRVNFDSEKARLEGVIQEAGQDLAQYSGAYLEGLGGADLAKMYQKNQQSIDEYYFKGIERDLDLASDELVQSMKDAGIIKFEQIDGEMFITQESAVMIQNFMENSAFLLSDDALNHVSGTFGAMTAQRNVFNTNKRNEARNKIPELDNQITDTQVEIRRLEILEKQLINNIAIRQPTNLITAGIGWVTNKKAWFDHEAKKLAEVRKKIKAKEQELHNLNRDKNTLFYKDDDTVTHLENKVMFYEVNRGSSEYAQVRYEVNEARKAANRDKTISDDDRNRINELSMDFVIWDIEDRRLELEGETETVGLQAGEAKATNTAFWKTFDAATGPSELVFNSIDEDYSSWAFANRNVNANGAFMLRSILESGNVDMNELFKVMERNSIVGDRKDVNAVQDYLKSQGVMEDFTYSGMVSNLITFWKGAGHIIAKETRNEDTTQDWADHYAKKARAEREHGTSSFLGFEVHSADSSEKASEYFSNAIMYAKAAGNDGMARKLNSEQDMVLREGLMAKETRKFTMLVGPLDLLAFGVPALLKIGKLVSQASKAATKIRGATRGVSGLGGAASSVLKVVPKVPGTGFIARAASVSGRAVGKVSDYTGNLFHSITGYGSSRTMKSLRKGINSGEIFGKQADILLQAQKLRDTHTGLRRLFSADVGPALRYANPVNWFGQGKKNLQFFSRMENGFENSMKAFKAVETSSDLAKRTAATADLLKKKSLVLLAKNPYKYIKAKQSANKLLKLSLAGKTRFIDDAFKEGQKQLTHNLDEFTSTETGFNRALRNYDDARNLNARGVLSSDELRNAERQVERAMHNQEIARLNMEVSANNLRIQRAISNANPTVLKKELDIAQRYANEIQGYSKIEGVLTDAQRLKLLNGFGQATDNIGKADSGIIQLKALDDALYISKQTGLPVTSAGLVALQKDMLTKVGVKKGANLKGKELAGFIEKRTKLVRYRSDQVRRIDDLRTQLRTMNRDEIARLLSKEDISQYSRQDLVKRLSRELHDAKAELKNIDVRIKNAEAAEKLTDIKNAKNAVSDKIAKGQRLSNDDVQKEINAVKKAEDAAREAPTKIIVREPSPRVVAVDDIRAKALSDMGIKEEAFTEYRIMKDGKLKPATKSDVDVLLREKLGITDEITDEMRKSFVSKHGDDLGINSYDQVRFKKGNQWISEGQVVEDIDQEIAKLYGKSREYDDLYKLGGEEAIKAEEAQTALRKQVAVLQELKTKVIGKEKVADYYISSNVRRIMDNMHPGMRSQLGDDAFDDLVRLVSEHGVVGKHEDIVNDARKILQRQGIAPPDDFDYMVKGFVEAPAGGIPAPSIHVKIEFPVPEEIAKIKEKAKAYRGKVSEIDLDLGDDAISELLKLSDDEIKQLGSTYVDVGLDDIMLNRLQKQYDDVLDELRTTLLDLKSAKKGSVREVELQMKLDNLKPRMQKIDAEFDIALLKKAQNEYPKSMKDELLEGIIEYVKSEKVELENKLFKRTAANAPSHEIKQINREITKIEQQIKSLEDERNFIRGTDTELIEAKVRLNKAEDIIVQRKINEIVRVNSEPFEAFGKKRGYTIEFDDAGDIKFVDSGGAKKSYEDLYADYTDNIESYSAMRLKAEKSMSEAESIGDYKAASEFERMARQVEFEEIRYSGYRDSLETAQNKALKQGLEGMSREELAKLHDGQKVRLSNLRQKMAETRAKAPGEDIIDELSKYDAEYRRLSKQEDALFDYSVSKVPEEIKQLEKESIVKRLPEPAEVPKKDTPIFDDILEENKAIRKRVIAEEFISRKKEEDIFGLENWNLKEENGKYMIYEGDVHHGTVDEFMDVQRDSIMHRDDILAAKQNAESRFIEKTLDIRAQKRASQERISLQEAKFKEADEFYNANYDDLSVENRELLANTRAKAKEEFDFAPKFDIDIPAHTKEEVVKINAKLEEIRKISPSPEEFENYETLYRGLTVDPDDVETTVNRILEVGMQSKLKRRGGSINDLSDELLRYNIRQHEEVHSTESIISLTTKQEIAEGYSVPRIGPGKGGLVVEIDPGTIKRGQLDISTQLSDAEKIRLADEGFLDSRFMHYNLDINGYDHEIIFIGDKIRPENIKSIKFNGQEIWNRAEGFRVSGKISPPVESPGIIERLKELFAPSGAFAVA